MWEVRGWGGGRFDRGVSSASGVVVRGKPAAGDGFVAWRGSIESVHRRRQSRDRMLIEGGTYQLRA